MGGEENNNSKSPRNNKNLILALDPLFGRKPDAATHSVVSTRFVGQFHRNQHYDAHYYRHFGDPLRHDWRCARTLPDVSSLNSKLLVVLVMWCTVLLVC